MASEAQTAANRRNAEKSTGPRTPEGKKTAAVNSVKHGLYSSLDSLSPEQRADFEGIFQHHFRTWRSPSDDEAHRLIREIALADFRRELARSAIFTLTAIEREVMHDEIDRHIGFDTREDVRDAAVLQNDFVNRNVLSRLFKMENSFTRLMDKSTRELRARFAFLAAHPEPAEGTCDTDCSPEFSPSPETNETNPIAPRPIACPCGSGEKYKRCCGKEEPPAQHSSPSTM